jgi:gas vesicle protein
VNIALSFKKNMKRAFYLILAGVAIGILVAPRKGSETRQKLKKEFRDWTEEALDQASDLVPQKHVSNVSGNGYDMDEIIENERELPVNEW